MTVERTASVALPEGVKPVLLEYRGEHHMGAEHVHFRLPFAVRGRRRYRTTNGTAYFSPARNALVLRDACVVLSIDLTNHSVQHLLPPSGWYLSDFAESEHGFELELFDGAGHRQSIRLAQSEIRFLPGLGPVRSGRFPSAIP
jgi:hypothetical protein